MIKSDSHAVLPCPRCGSPEQLRIAQTVFRSVLRWHESLDCRHCGLRTEAHGVGLPSVDVRGWLLSLGGEWSVVMEKVKSTRSVAGVLQKHLSLGTQSIADLLRAGGGNEIYRGTKVEVLWLIDLLKAVGEEPMAVSPD
jgi:hypothetical protein